MSAAGTARMVFLIGLAAIFLAGCAAPYATTPAKEAQRELSAQGVKVVAVCYNSALNAPERVLLEARLACGGGTVTFHDDDVIWTKCGLLQPVRANFICTPRPLPE
ncbi:MAG: hypothetical protein V3S40_08150 [Kiloniellales bacterium]